MFQSNDSSLWPKFWWVSSNSNHNDEGTGGAYDAFQNPKAASAELFSKEFGMSYGDATNFGDCHFGIYFSSGIVRYVDRSFQQVQASGAFQMPKRSNGLNLAYYLPSLIPPMCIGSPSKQQQ
jgi:hypothetical protein